MKFFAAASPCLLGAALVVAVGWTPACAEPLQPWQMVRSLQLVQDRVADGDAAALPIQRKLLEMIDARLRTTTPEELAEPRNWDAVMVYATAGGNPATVKALMPDLLAAADAVASKAEAAAKAASGEEEAEDEEASENAHAESSGQAEEGSHAEEAGHAEEGAHADPAKAHGEEAEAGAHALAEQAEGHAAAGGKQEAAESVDTEHAAKTEASAHREEAAETSAHPEPAAEASAHPKAADEIPAAGESHGSGEPASHEPAPAAHSAPEAPQAEEAAAKHAAPSAGHGEATDPVVTHSTEKPSGHEGGEKAGGHGAAAEGKAGKHGDEAAAELAEPPQLQNRDLALGVYNYGRGREPDAARALAKIDPMAQRPELGAFVALVKGSLVAKNDPAEALKLFDQARLIAPGTLVEEAALRRSLQLAIAVKDRARFLLGGSQYARRFLRSPYASQFADTFVAGVIALHEGLDLQAVADVTADMAPEQERVVYLRIARQAGIDNLMALSAFASSKSDAKPEEVAASADPRTALYSALSEITGEKSGEAVARLNALDPRRLTASDRELLAAVKAVAAGTVRPPAALPSPEVAPDEVDAASEQPARDEDVRSKEEASLKAEAAAPGETAESTGEPAELDSVDEKVAATRKTLADVDKLLVEAGK